MKKLICASDVKEKYELGQRIIEIDQQTLITPAAKDLAEEYQLTFQCKTLAEKSTHPDLQPELSKEFLLSLLKQLLADETLNLPLVPYKYLKHASGLKIVNGASIQMDLLATGNSQAKISHQTVLTENESSLRAGIFIIEASEFTYKALTDETAYLIQGQLELSLNGQTYQAEAGDILFFPKDSQVTLSSSELAKIYYSGLGKEEA